MKHCENQKIWVRLYAKHAVKASPESLSSEFDSYYIDKENVKVDPFDGETSTNSRIMEHINQLSRAILGDQWRLSTAIFLLQEIQATICSIIPKNGTWFKCVADEYSDLLFTETSRLCDWSEYNIVARVEQFPLPYNQTGIPMAQVAQKHSWEKLSSDQDQSRWIYILKVTSHVKPSVSFTNYKK